MTTPSNGAPTATSLSGALTLVALALGTSQAHAREKLDVVATFSILGGIVSEIGGDHVAVKTLVRPDGAAQVFEPTPHDARAVSEPDVVVANGFGLEGWLDRLIGASAMQGLML